MRAHEIINQSKLILAFLKSKQNNTSIYYTLPLIASGLSNLTENLEKSKIKTILLNTKSVDSFNIGDRLSVLNVLVLTKTIEIWGFKNQRSITNIEYTSEGPVIEFDHDSNDTWPNIKQLDATTGKMCYSLFFNTEEEFSKTLLLLQLSVSDEFDIRNYTNEST